jgi:hypothetical protein
MSCDINRVSQVFQVTKSADMLEIPQILRRIRNLWYIADTCNSATETGIDDITSFLSL